MMYWTVFYILAIGLPLVVLFLLCCTLLLRRSHRRSVYQTPESISTPLGCTSGDWKRQVDDLPTQPYLPRASAWEFQAHPGRLEQGIERARTRQYHLKGKE